MCQEKERQEKSEFVSPSQWMTSSDVSGKMLYVGRANGKDDFLYRS
jgi:hypothetical protein